MVNEVIRAQTSTFHPLTKHQWKDKIKGQQVKDFVLLCNRISIRAKV